MQTNELTVLPYSQEIVNLMLKLSWIDPKMNIGMSPGNENASMSLSSIKGQKLHWILGLSLGPVDILLYLQSKQCQLQDQDGLFFRKCSKISLNAFLSEFSSYPYQERERTDANLLLTGQIFGLTFRTIFALKSLSTGHFLCFLLWWTSDLFKVMHAFFYRAFF